MSFGSFRSSAALEATAQGSDGAGLWRGRVVRDYGMFNRRKASQHYPDVNRKAGRQGSVGN